MDSAVDLSRFTGLQINFQANDLLVEHYQFRFPRSKKKRIRKKWEKDKRNYRERPSSECYIINHDKMGWPFKRSGITVVGHPITLLPLEKKFDEMMGLQSKRGF